MARFVVSLLVVAALTGLAVVVVGAQLPPDANSAQAFLTPHNAARSKVGVAALKWNANLAAYALSFATSQRSKCLPLTHSGGPFGENLFWGSGKAWTPNDAVTSWVGEGTDYHYSTNTCTPGKVCGHYTQVVWRATTDVGCASALCSDNSIYIICSYNPPGNYVGQRPY
jgi:pathogenesis-related protein 1